MKTKVDHTVEKSAVAGMTVGLASGIGFTAVSGKIGIALMGAAVGTTVIVPLMVTGFAIGGRCWDDTKV